MSSHKTRIFRVFSYQERKNIRPLDLCTYPHVRWSVTRFKYAIRHDIIAWCACAIYFLPVNKHSQKPIIIVFTTAYDPFVGGAEIAIREIASRLADRFDFYILTSRFERRLPFREERAGMHIVRLGIGHRHDKFFLPFFAFFACLAIIVRSRGRKKILWAVMASYGSLAASALRTIFGRIPLILTLQEGDPEEHLRTSRLGLINLTMRFDLFCADQVTAISRYLLHVAWKFGYGKWGTVIPNGVDIAHFTKQYPEDELLTLRRSLGLISGERVVITTSRLVKKNAVDMIVRALERVRMHDGRRVRLLVLGTGPEAPRLRELAAGLAISDHVLFVGTVLHDELPKFLAIADVFVRPSRSEGLGNSFLEAMAAGVPIIGTPVGGIPDFLEDRKTGLEVGVDDVGDIAEKIRLVLSDDDLRRRIIAGAKRFIATRYDWGRIAEEFGGVFDRELEKASKTAVVLATGIFPPDIGGPATASALLEEELSRRAFKVSVVTYADPDDARERTLGEITERVRHADVFRISRALPKGLRHAWYCIHVFFATLHADVVYAQDAVPAGFPAWLAARLLGKAFIVKITGDYAWERGVQRFGVRDLLDDFQKGSYGVRVGLLRICRSFVSRRADSVITPCEYLKTLVVGWGVPPERITVVHNSISVPERFPDAREARGELGLDDKAELFLSAGRLVPWKGFRALIGAFADARVAHSAARLYIAGSGPERHILEEEIGARNLVGKVVLLGSVGRETLFLYIRAADAFVLNTGYEGFSHQLLEAMALGTPVITTSTGGNSEIITDRETGLLVSYNDVGELEDAMRLLLSDTRLRNKIAYQGQMSVLKLTPNAMMEKLLPVIDVRRAHS